tara:strand:+ start:31098 stop:31838 length:741 start_codon:yes stop_codon:yes gene_type:complete
LIICDHATNNIPSNFQNLGLDNDLLDTHIAYDIGAKEVSIHLSRILNCPLVMSDFSRLLIDPNRGIDDPTLVMKISDDKIIEGNKNIDNFRESIEKNKRIEDFYNTYHDKVSELIRQKTDKEQFPAIISIHSFTPFWKNIKRNIDIGILWDNDKRLPNIFFNYFEKNHPELVIGNNQPYTGRLKNDSIYKHATVNGLSNILIEIRQDLITKKSGQKHFAELLSRPLLQNINNPVLFSKKIYPSLAK